jgi:hypothetical protein
MRLLKKEREMEVSIRRDYLRAPSTTRKTRATIENASVVDNQVTPSLNQGEEVCVNKIIVSRRTHKKRIATGFCIAFSLIGTRYYWATHAPISYPQTPLPIVLKPAETTPNSLYFYEQVALQMKGKNPAFALSGDAKCDTLKVCQKVVDANTDTLKLLREGIKHKGMSLNSKKSGYWYNKTISAKEGFLYPEKSMPNFVIERTIARLFVAESQLKASKGDYLRSVNSNLDGLAFSTSIQTSDRHLDFMILILMQKTNLEAMMPQIKHLTTKQAKDALARFNASEKNLPDIRRSIVGQEKAGMEVLQVMTPETMTKYMTTTLYDVYPQYGMQAPAAPKWLSATVTYAWTAGELFWKGQTGLANDWHQHQASAYKKLSLPYRQSQQIPSYTMHSYLLKARPFREFLDIDYDRVHFAYTQMRTRIQTIKAQLAIAAYRGEHGRQNPKSLSELVKVGYLEEVPLDPFSENADTPLQYKDGKIWSVGQNGFNENGGGDDDLPSR